MRSTLSASECFVFAGMWSLVATDSADGVAVPLRRAGEVSLESCYLAYAVECKNCGHVRMMSKVRVEELAGGG